MNRIHFLIIFILISVSGFSQQDLMMGGFVFGGIPLNKYEQNRAILASRTMTSQIGIGLNIQYKVFNRLGIEAGILQNSQFRKLKDKNFEDRNDGFKVLINSYNSYWSWYGALQYNHPLSHYSFLYSKVGYGVNHFGKDKLSKSENFVVTDENVQMINEYQDKNMFWFIEAGLETSLSDKFLFNIGLRFNKGLSTMVSGNYQVEKDGTVLSTDVFSSDGSFIALSTGLKFLLYHKDKKPKKVKRIEIPSDSDSKPEEPEILEDKVEGRDLKVAKSISVAKPNVVIRVWDNEMVDGDIISLNLNDTWVIQNFTLEKSKKELQVTLKEGKNILVLHALNLGRVAPNTAAVSVDDGHKTQKLVLSSDLDESGTLIIYYKKP